MARPLLQTDISSVVGKIRLVGVNADACPDRRIFYFAAVLLRQMNAAVSSIRPIAVTNGEISFNPTLFRARQNFVAVAVVAFAFKMSVGVNEHGRVGTGL